MSRVQWARGASISDRYSRARSRDLQLIITGKSTSDVDFYRENVPGIGQPVWFQEGIRSSSERTSIIWLYRQMGSLLSGTSDLCDTRWSWRRWTDLLNQTPVVFWFRL